MATTDLTQAIIWEDGDACCMARVQLDGSDVLKSELSSVTRKIFDLDGSTPTAAASESSLVVATTVFDTLQTDGRWTQDTTGYNFRDTIAGSNFPEADRSYRVEYKFVGANGEVAFAVFILDTQGVYSS